jgi:hypothetical protein
MKPVILFILAATPRVSKELEKQLKALGYL